MDLTLNFKEEQLAWSLIIPTIQSVLEEGYLIEEGTLTEFQKMLQEGGLFLIRGGSDHRTNQNYTKGGSNTLHLYIIGGLKNQQISQFILKT